MSKVYKKGNKLSVNIPFEVVEALDITDGEEVDFFKYSDKYFLFAKKSDIVNAITGSKIEAAAAAPRKQGMELTADEISVLKKLDTLRYADRTKENVRKLLDHGETSVLKALLKKKAVKLFRKEGDKDDRVSIPKNVYDAFLFGKRDLNAKLIEHTAPQKLWEVKLKEHNKYAEELESKGYVVCQNESEASQLSSLLEESIRQGLVVGTRAFNKKFYVALKRFVVENTAAILKLIERRGMHVSDVSKALNAEEDAMRTVLYLLAESGTVLEVRRDVFKSA